MSATSVHPTSSCYGCGTELRRDDLGITSTSPDGRRFIRLCVACRTPEGLRRLDQRFRTPGTMPCESCGRPLTRDEEVDSTLGPGFVVRYYCEDCKTPY